MIIQTSLISKANMGSKSLLIGFILVHVLLLSYFSFTSNASNSEIFHGSLLDSPQKLINTMKRRMPPSPPSPKRNKPVHFISNASNYEVFDGSVSNSPHKLVKTIKRRMPPRPPSPKPNIPIHFSPPPPKNHRFFTAHSWILLVSSSTQLNAGCRRVHRLRNAIFISYASNYEVFHGSFSDSPGKLVKTIKRKIPSKPPSPKLNSPPHFLKSPPPAPAPPPPPACVHPPPPPPPY
ncbi:hypothetical protein CR513_14961, partial [Mucuna pruriens]